MPMGRQPTRGQVAGIAAAVLTLLGSGGGAGYYLHEAAPVRGDAFPMERGTALEARCAVQDALRERDREDARQMLRAIQENTATTASLQQAVVGFTERLKVLESGALRPASMRR
jgi:hypothetical protein